MFQLSLSRTADCTPPFMIDVYTDSNPDDGTNDGTGMNANDRSQGRYLAPTLQRLQSI